MTLKLTLIVDEFKMLARMMMMKFIRPAKPKGPSLY
jgi:hypothetical protein